MKKIIQAVCLLLTISLLTPEVQADVVIKRDKQGIPHVFGETSSEVFFGFGYIMARDRLFQMEMRKRQARGTVAEVLGKGEKNWPDKYLSKDREARVMHDTAALEREYQALPLEDKQLIEAFTAGVNKTILETLSDATHKLPRPFSEYGFLPHPWTVTDTLVYAVDVLGAYSSFSTELLNMELYAFLRQKYPQACDDIFNQLLWKTDPNAPTTARDQQQGGPDPDDKGPKGCADQAPNGLLMAKKSIGLSSLDPILTREATPKRASMAWLAGRDKAAGFNSIFVNGPQPGWHVPSYYYPIGLHGGGFNLVGFAAEGSLVIEAGVNDRFTWGVTAGLGNHVDYFQEQLEGPHSNSYRVGKGWQEMTNRTEVIKIAGAEPEQFEVRSTRHGPVVASDPSSSLAFAEAVSWKGAGVASVMAWVNASKAENYQQWLGYAQNFAFGYNWFFADREGQVGSVFTGRFATRRPDHDIRLPATGRGDYDWTGFLPKDANPALLTTGFIANFNNKPKKNWPNSGLFWEQWGEANQVDILVEQMTKKERLSWKDMWAINRVVAYRDVSASYFVPYILKAVGDGDGDPELAEAARLIAGWNQMRTDDDGDGKFDSAGQTLFDAWLPIMVRSTLAPTLDGFDKAGIWLAAGYQTKAPRLEEHPSAGTLATYHALLSEDKRSGVHHYFDFFAGHGYRAVIRQSLHAAIEALKKKQSGEMKTWRSRAVEQVFFDSNANRIPMTSPGYVLTLPLYGNRGALNFMTGYSTDGKRVVGGYINPPGQSGFIAPDGTKSPLAETNMQSYQHDVLRALHLTLSSIMDGPGELIQIRMDDPFKQRL